MAVAEQRPSNGKDPALHVTVSPSAAVELHWITMLDKDGRLRLTHPSLAPLAARRDLVDALGSFWGADARGAATQADRSLPELLVLADKAGVLRSTDLGAVVADATEAAATRTGPLPLASETGPDRDVINGRLGALMSSRRRRRAWATLLGEVVAVVDEHWTTTGLDVSRRATRARASQLPWAEPAATVLAWARRDYGGLLPELIHQAAVDARTVQVVPSYWSGNGAMFDLGECLLVGIPAQQGPADSRVRTEPMVRVLKAMADPTRLAMLDHLVARPRTVGELAGDFGLAQPTASRHVRLLRDAGLVVDVRHKSVNLIQVNTASVARLLRTLAATFGTDGPTAPDGSQAPDTT